MQQRTPWKTVITTIIVFAVILGICGVLIHNRPAQHEGRVYPPPPSGQNNSGSRNIML